MSPAKPALLRSRRTLRGAPEFCRHEAYEVLEAIDTRLPLTRREVPRPPLPLSTDVNFHRLRCRDLLAACTVNWRIHPPHVGCDIWITGRKAKQNVSGRAVEARGQGPPSQDHTGHGTVLVNVVFDRTIVQ